VVTRIGWEELLNAQKRRLSLGAACKPPHSKVGAASLGRRALQVWETRLDGEGFGDGLGFGEALGERSVFEGFADLAYYAFTGEGLLEEEGVLEEVVVGCGAFEVAGHVDDFEVGEQSF
jgi:hypothetical protein